MKVMRPSLLPGLVAAARRNIDRGAASVRLFEIGRRYLGRRRAPDARAAARRGRGAARLAVGQGAGVRRLRRQGRSAGAARGRGRADRQSAGVPRRRPDLAPGPLGEARPRPQDDPRRASASFTRASPRASMRRPARSPPKSTSMRSPRRARAAAPAPLLRRRRCRRSPAISPSSSRPSFAADALVRAIRGADKAAIAAARLFDRFESDGRPVAGVRSHAPAGREELHRRRDRRRSRSESSPRPKSSARAYGAEFERVDRGVDARLDLVALEARPGSSRRP